LVEQRRGRAFQGSRSLAGTSATVRAGANGKACSPAWQKTCLPLSPPDRSTVSSPVQT
jgi:hypothetical protein